MLDSGCDIVTNRDHFLHFLEEMTESIFKSTDSCPKWVQWSKCVNCLLFNWVSIEAINGVLFDYLLSPKLTLGLQMHVIITLLLIGCCVFLCFVESCDIYAAVYREVCRPNGLQMRVSEQESLGVCPVLSPFIQFLNLKIFTFTWQWRRKKLKVGGWLDLSETLTSKKKRRLCMTLYSFAQYFPNGLFLINFFFCYSGFIFLRLLCPAILNPKSFNLITGIAIFCIMFVVCVPFLYKMFIYRYRQVHLYVFPISFRNTIRCGLSNLKTNCKSITELGKFSGIWNQSKIVTCTGTCITGDHYKN